MKDKLIKLLQPYQKRFGYDQKYEWDKLAFKFLRKKKTILDIGCGEGRFISLSPKKIMGVDHNKQSLDICKKKGYNVKYANVTKLPFKDNSFDAVHSCHVIEHLFPNEAHDFLKEMNRVLKKGGIFCLRAPLLHRGFYHDLTHIKPYYPEAVLHYIKITKRNQRTLEDINCSYKKIKLLYRREQLFFGIVNTIFWPLGIIFNMLQRFGISSYKKTGYMLVLRKK
jgi:ubiquinone/menaquinone biosynthesis C-methylase UbiE